MGCENSKTVRVQPVGAASLSRDNTHMVSGKEGATQTPEMKSKNILHTSASRRSELSLDEFGRKVKSSGRSRSGKNGKRVKSPSTKDLMGSCDTLDCNSDNDSLNSDRGNSATSKQSADSGLGEDYSHVITEYSEKEKTLEVERAFKPRDDLELGITGVQCGTRNSARDRARMEEAQIMQSLREEGLISKPEVQSSGGMCFEIVQMSGDGMVKPPPRLEKLERRRKKKETLTEDEIRDKLERAERRRKKREQERLEKIKEMERTDALAALENFAQYQKSKVENLTQRMDQVNDRKEQQMRDLKERQERRKKHAEEVRRRKALAKEQGITNDSEDSQPQTPRPESSALTSGRDLKSPPLPALMAASRQEATPAGGD